MDVTPLMERLRQSGVSSTAAEKPACPLCGGTGTILRRDDQGRLYGRDCDCEIKRQNYRRLRNAGLLDLVDTYTFDAFETRTPKQAAIKAAAQKYVSEGAGDWFFICGRPGSGKSHICTAMVSELIRQGKNCCYFRWREKATRLKALVTEPDAYSRAIRLPKTADVLYIDDFLKGKITDADVNLAFEILDYRYCAKLPTVISSERELGDLMSLDEAVGSRIYERSRNYCYKTDPVNMRIGGGDT